MARHNEILTQFQEATPVFDYNNKVHTNLVSVRALLKNAHQVTKTFPLPSYAWC